MVVTGPDVVGIWKVPAPLPVGMVVIGPDVVGIWKVPAPLPVGTVATGPDVVDIWKVPAPLPVGMVVTGPDVVGIWKVPAPLPVGTVATGTDVVDIWKVPAPLLVGTVVTGMGWNVNDGAALLCSAMAGWPAATLLAMWLSAQVGGPMVKPCPLAAEQLLDVTATATANTAALESIQNRFFICILLFASDFVRTPKESYW